MEASSSAGPSTSRVVSFDEPCVEEADSSDIFSDLAGRIEETANCIAAISELELDSQGKTFLQIANKIHMASIQAFQLLSAYNQLCYLTKDTIPKKEQEKSHYEALTELYQQTCEKHRFSLLEKQENLLTPSSSSHQKSCIQLKEILQIKQNQYADARMLYLNSQNNLDKTIYVLENYAEQIRKQEAGLKPFLLEQMHHYQGYIDQILQKIKDPLSPSEQESFLLEMEESFSSFSQILKGEIEELKQEQESLLATIKGLKENICDLEKEEEILMAKVNNMYPDINQLQAETLIKSPDFLNNLAKLIKLQQKQSDLIENCRILQVYMDQEINKIETMLVDYENILTIRTKLKKINSIFTKLLNKANQLIKELSNSSSTLPSPGLNKLPRQTSTTRLCQSLREAQHLSGMTSPQQKYLLRVLKRKITEQSETHMNTSPQLVTSSSQNVSPLIAHLRRLHQVPNTPDLPAFPPSLHSTGSTNKARSPFAPKN